MTLRLRPRFVHKYWPQGLLHLIRRISAIKIDPGATETIRKELARKGIHHATVYGDFDKVCASICRECGL